MGDIQSQDPTSLNLCPPKAATCTACTNSSFSIENFCTTCVQELVQFGYGDNVTCEDYNFLPWELGYGFLTGAVALFEAVWIYYFFCKKT